MQRLRKAVKQVPTKLRRGSKLLGQLGTLRHRAASSSVHVLSDHALQDEIEEEKTVVLTNSIDIGSEITTAGTFTCSCTQWEDLEEDRRVDADGKVGAYDATVSNGESELLPLQQTPWDDIMDTEMLTESESEKLLDLENHVNQMDGEEYCTCGSEELCPCQWEGNSTMVHLTDLICTSSRIWGRVQVNNVAYEKQILVRWSSDAWKSFSEQSASFEQSETNLKRDAFTFEIERPQHEETVELAVRYCVCNQEYWDNNDGNNYQVLGTY